MQYNCNKNAIQLQKKCNTIVIITIKLQKKAIIAIKNAIIAIIVNALPRTMIFVFHDS